MLLISGMIDILFLAGMKYQQKPVRHAGAEGLCSWNYFGLKSCNKMLEILVTAIYFLKLHDTKTD
jgi:hypothetical protein